MPSVLIVDDEELNRMPLAALLGSEGYGVLEAADGMEALHVIDSQHVDLVLLDVVMPGMDGFDTCAAIREKPGFLTLPIVFTTALGDRDSRVRGKAVGGDDFLTKPVDPVELIIRVKNLLKLKAYADEQLTEKRSLEDRLLQAREQLLHADRLANLGTMAATIGHELQSACGILNATLDFIRSDLEKGGRPRDEDINNLELVRVHLRNHATSMLEMGRPGTPDSVMIELRQLIEQTLALLKMTGRLKRISVEVNFPPEDVNVEGSRSRMQQVFINLIGNGIDALMERSGDRRMVIALTVDSAGGMVTCSVRNNGPPVPGLLQEEIFSPFYTTKGDSGGTGLGLCVVRQILDACRGTVCVRTVDEWTEFLVALPFCTGVDR